MKNKEMGYSESFCLTDENGEYSEISVENGKVYLTTKKELSKKQFMKIYNSIKQEG